MRALECFDEDRPSAVSEDTGFGSPPDQDVGACVDQVRQFLVVADLEVAIRVVVEMVLEPPEMGIDAWFRTGAQQDELGALVQAAEDSVVDEMHPLLRVQAAHVGHEGLVVVAQPLSLAQGAGIVGLGTEVPREAPEKETRSAKAKTEEPAAAKLAVSAKRRARRARTFWRSSGQREHCISFKDRYRPEPDIRREGLNVVSRRIADVADRGLGRLNW